MSTDTRWIKMSLGLEELIESGFAVRLRQNTRETLGPSHSVIVTGRDGTDYVLGIAQDDSNVSHFARMDFDRILAYK